MSLLDRLREAQDEPARHRASPYVGPSILTVEQLRAMERALAHEGFFDRDRETTAPDVAAAPRVIDEPLPIWTPPEAISVTAVAAPPDQAPGAQALPVWSPPDFEAAAAVATLDPCPNCGEDVEIERIDLTANAGWFTCRACGLRWGGTIDPSPAVRGPVPPALLPTQDFAGERGRIAAG